MERLELVVNIFSYCKGLRKLLLQWAEYRIKTWHWNLRYDIARCSTEADHRMAADWNYFKLTICSSCFPLYWVVIFSLLNGLFFQQEIFWFFAFFSSLLITVNELLSFMILFRSNIVLFKRFWKWRTGAVSCPWRHPREFRGRWEQIQNVEDPISLVTRGNHNTQPTKSRLFLQKHFKIKFSKIRLAILKIFQNFGKRFSEFHHLSRQLIAIIMYSC